MTVQERRKWPRRKCEKPAWIEHQDSLLACRICDISEGGARLQGNFDAVGERLALRLTENGAVARLCVAVWKAGNEMGVQFLARRSDPPADSLLEID